jgi:hypothetical protein
MTTRREVITLYLRQAHDPRQAPRPAGGLVTQSDYATLKKTRISPFLPVDGFERVCLRL